MTSEELRNNNIVKEIVSTKNSFPCRITLQESEIGEEIFLLNFEFHKVDSPYRGNRAIYIRPNRKERIYETNEIPEIFKTRLISLRGYDKNGMMLYADVFEGKNLRAEIMKAFINLDLDYLHIHNAKAGCYLSSAVRV